MTPDERRQAALAEVSAALKKYGCKLDAVITEMRYVTRQMGTSLLTDTDYKTQIIVVELPDWTPPNGTPAEMPANVDTEKHA